MMAETGVLRLQLTIAKNPGMWSFLAAV